MYKNKMYQDIKIQIQDSLYCVCVHLAGFCIFRLRKKQKHVA